ncbi:unnamed protein product [Arabis nemorensis]|uniref:Uncharacterized protein n=1 Tax=Arabis nemorensis TaxID=586526 RepID=A0A565CW08_9BRAS|nr:unnamed protein product [Arabis nemorensis]
MSPPCYPSPPPPVMDDARVMSEFVIPVPDAKKMSEEAVMPLPCYKSPPPPMMQQN